jgi:hypothetical protein
MPLEKYTPQMKPDIVVNHYYLYGHQRISLYICGLLWPCRHFYTSATRSTLPT